MTSIFAVLVASTVILMIDLPTLKRKKYIKEIWSFITILFISTGLSIVWLLHIPVPSLFIILEVIYKPWNDAVTFLLT